jgi:hypothetical protein
VQRHRHINRISTACSLVELGGYVLPSVPLAKLSGHQAE